MITKYRLTTWETDNIKKVTFKGETAKFFIAEDGRKEAKTCNFHQHFDTWEEANNARIERLKKKIEKSKSHTAQLESYLEAAKNDKELTTGHPPCQPFSEG